LSKII